MATYEPPGSGSRPGSGPAFPQRNAFVLQFAADIVPEQGPVRGRVQHVSTGEQAAFETLEELWSFVSRILFGPGADPATATADG